MAIFSEDAKIYADLIRDKNRLKAQIANGGITSYQIKKDDSGRVKIYDFSPVIRVRSLNDDAWIWDHPTQSVWDSSNWDTGSSGVAGRWTDIVRRRWEWFRKQDLKQVYSEGNLSTGGTIINLTNNEGYLRPEVTE